MLLAKLNMPLLASNWLSPLKSLHLIFTVAHQMWVFFVNEKRYE